jgi:hypothetical protein
VSWTSNRVLARRLRVVLGSAVAIAMASTAFLGAHQATGTQLVTPANAAVQARAVNTVLAASGSWCWFQEPRAVYFHGRYARTYVGYVDNAGDIKVSMYDHVTASQATSTLRARFVVDDHASPAILVRPNGTLVVFWSGHGGDTMYYRRSLRPEDISAWGPVETVPTNSPGPLGYTYANPVQLSAESNRVYLFWRGGKFNPTYSTSDDGATTWAPAKTFISMPGQRPYVKVVSDGRDTIHFAFTEAHPRDVITSIYYMYYRGGFLYRADGTRIGRLGETPIVPSQATKVYDASSTGIGAWVQDIAIDKGGRPVITYSTFPTPTDHRYRYARWTGTAWHTSELTGAGGSISTDPVEYQYSGGISIDHDNPSVVYLSRPVRGVYEIERWATVDGGSTWTHKAITSGSTENNIRPISPWGLPNDGPMSVIWLSGRYGTYTTFQTRIMRVGGS